MFEAIEQSAPAPLPVRPFKTVQYSQGTFAPDCNVKAGKAFHSVPWRLLEQKVPVRTVGDIVQVFHDDTVAATHVSDLAGRSTNSEQNPTAHGCAHSARVTWCRNQAEQIGSKATKVINELSSVNAIPRLPAIRAIIRPARNTTTPASMPHGPELNHVQYRTIKGLLVARTEHGDRTADQPSAPPPSALLCGTEEFDTAQNA